MSRPPMPPESNEEPSIQLSEGWHCLHIYYQVDQVALNQLSAEERSRGVDAVCELLDENREGAPIRLQTSVVSGHRADLGLMMMDPDPLVIDRICQQLRATPLGPVLKPTYSFVSLTEISEYVPTVEQFSEKLIREGAKPEDPMFQARVKGYEQRLPAMNQQRIYPEIPPYPVVCFYPMNKIRVPEANWYDQPFSVRSELMAEHATSGIKFAGRVSQLITASTGLDDWEWGVTLWAKNPAYIKDIVYTMRFDKASARYAEFGSFYIGYVKTAREILEHLEIVQPAAVEG
ncbi:MULTISPECIES: hydrogen peroxide-dependent heme synthase [Rubinisphaera]|uniref:Chlorite dismutase n=1 Tax=Rubinisphaera brasiliensis (strain ATCC 49424 / DSM 5305 / JCM 21570 / IAM 15109 / NBRC 103401 / IFAM 1448) TaxID=756272 RepID=F0SNH9_RUBBR|nr:MULTISPECIES: hydrogen peroxide-dependent heme synthase [Rubinisphaera]ADY57813.1 Chlorite dismutase [Rubinisphaera brasiliensis DSM 5305]